MKPVLFITFSFYSSDIFVSRDSVKYEPIISSKRSVSGKTRTRTLKDLLKIDLINQLIYDDILPKIKKNEVFLESQIFSISTERMYFYSNFDAKKAKQLTFIENLVKEKMISVENQKRIIASYKPYEIKERFEFLPYCNNALVFDLKKYSLNPLEYYPLIFNEIKKIVPNFNFTNFTIAIKKSDYGDLIRQDAVFSFKISNKKYTHTGFQKFKRKIPDSTQKPDTLAKVSEEFHKCVNKYLKDINSDKRLYFVKNIVHGTGYSLEKDFGLILMTEKQRALWGEDMSTFSREKHENTFNTEGVQNLIKEYQQIGLFEHLTKNEVDSAFQKIEVAEINSFSSILSCFPKTIVYFDWESGNLENPYEELTLEFAASSRGAFTPTLINDNFEKDEKNKTTRYGFTLKGKRHETDLEMQSDWLDPKFMELIETALTEHNIDGEIYRCLDNGQAAGYIFF